MEDNANALQGAKGPAGGTCSYSSQTQRTAQLNLAVALNYEPVVELCLA